MRKLLGLLLVLLPIAAFSQQMANGFGVEFYTGTTYISGENFKFTYGDQINTANVVDSKYMGGAVCFPFDLGIKRHRFTIAPALEYRVTTLSLNAQFDIKKPSKVLVPRDQLSLRSTTYAPMLFVMYRPHFYIGRLHMSFCIGAGIKYIVINTAEICDNDNAALIKHDQKDPENSAINVSENESAQIICNKGLNIDPRIGFDFYFNNSVMLSIYAAVPDIQNYINHPGLYYSCGVGLTYIIKTNKITEAKILQQYKK